jgi:hypothetical protein
LLPKAHCFACNDFPPALPLKEAFSPITNFRPIAKCYTGSSCLIEAVVNPNLPCRSLSPLSLTNLFTGTLAQQDKLEAGRCGLWSSGE